MERKLTAIFSADVQGYSRLMGEDEEATIRTLTAYREVMTSHIQQYRGRVVDAPGDNLLAEFASAVDAVQAAVEIQKALRTRNTALSEHRQMHYRIGINIGDVVVEGERIYGDGVNIAARLESLAEGGGISISGTVYDQVKNKLALAYQYRGEHEVKNITDPVRMYTVELQTETVVPSMSGEQPAPLPLPNKPSIAVLPFTNMSADREQEYFSDGITDDLITDLSKVSGLFVIARNSTFAYKGQAVKVAQVSRELGVRYVLEGSVRKAGNRVRVNVQLIDALTSGHVWAERYDRELKDIFALQDEVTQKVVFALTVKLTSEEQARFRQAPTDNLEAYDFYLRAEASYWRYTKGAYAQARQMLERAIELDSEYAAAYAALARTYITERAMLWSLEPQTLEKAFAMAHRAVALDDSLPWAHVGLGTVYLWKKEHTQAIAEAERAVALDPNFADGYITLGYTLGWAGRPEESIRLVEKAMRLNPHYPFLYLFYLGRAYYTTGHPEEAIEVLRSVLTRNPDFTPAYAYLAASYSELGQETAARAKAAAVLRLNPHISLTNLRQILPYKDQASFERFLTALRKAGLE
jgi:adenylate cyclase